MSDNDKIFCHECKSLAVLVPRPIVFYWWRKHCSCSPCRFLDDRQQKKATTRTSHDLRVLNPRSLKRRARHFLLHSVFLFLLYSDPLKEDEDECTLSLFFISEHTLLYQKLVTPMQHPSNTIAMPSQHPFRASTGNYNVGMAENSLHLWNRVLGREGRCTAGSDSRSRWNIPVPTGIGLPSSTESDTWNTEKRINNLELSLKLTNFTSKEILTTVEKEHMIKQSSKVELE